ncbi:MULTISPECIES: ParM/StbA family protein [Salinibacter]|uniref:ParM/StbA family protein n=1 Tax=Salinibacter TaxID=146918 RepID=UPI0021E79AF3|nr:MULTISPECIES: ParM/StbA family protein [Salinibacter]
MFKTKTLPSVFEASNAELVDVSDSLLTGLKIGHNGRSYVVGELALLEGNAPHKGINNAPSDLDYRLLLQAALAVTKAGAEEPMCVTTGFPASTYAAHRDTAEDLVQGTHVIDLDGRTFGKSPDTSIRVEVDQVEIIPEIEGFTFGVRQGEPSERDPFFAVGLGYGTMEAALSLPSGIVQRTTASASGLQYATQLMSDRLQKEHYLDLVTEHQLDMAMRKGRIVIGRRKMDLTEMRQDVLSTYYEDIVSPTLKRAFDDADFGRARKMYVGGGGALFDELVDAFADEFGDVLSLEVVPNPASFISRGYALHAANANGGHRERAVGLDIGNANTVINLLHEESV